MHQTKKLYQEDMYLREASCRIIKIQENILVLEQTPFYPEGGGQPCDLGMIEDYEVLHVWEEDGCVLHKLSGAPDWRAGGEVRCAVNWDRRFDHMQNHCGEHILSGIFFRRFGGVNRGFRLGSDMVTIDIDFRGTPNEGLKAETLDLDAIELEANQIIWADTPVSIRYFAQQNDAAHLPLRKALAVERDISIVCVGSENNPADCVACCGTHPSTAGQVGLIKLLRAENYKGMVRFYLKCGKRALEDYRLRYDIVHALKVRYSAKEDTILDLLAARDKKTAALRRELKELKKAPAGEGLRSMLNNADRA